MLLYPIEDELLLVRNGFGGTKPSKFELDSEWSTGGLMELQHWGSVGILERSNSTNRVSLWIISKRAFSAIESRGHIRFTEILSIGSFDCDAPIQGTLSVVRLVSLLHVSIAEITRLSAALIRCSSLIFSSSNTAVSITGGHDNTRNDIEVVRMKPPCKGR